MFPALWPKLREAKCLAQGHPSGEAELGSAHEGASPGEAPGRQSLSPQGFPMGDRAHRQPEKMTF